MMENLDSREVDEWRVYDATVGLPDRRDDIRAGVIAATIVNTTPRKSKGKALGPADFFPDLNAEKTTIASSMDMKARLQSAWGAHIKKAAPPNVDNSVPSSDPRP